MRFSTIAAVTALLTVTAADAQNVRAPVSTDPGGTDSSVETRARKETLRRTPLHRHPRECEHPYCSHGYHHDRRCDRVNLEALGSEGESHPQAAEASGLHRLGHSELRRWGSS